MAGTNKNLTGFKVGNSRNIRVTIKDKTTGLPIDISGDKFYFTVKDSVNVGDSVAELQASVVAPADAISESGVVVIKVSAAATAAVAAGSYDYDIMWIKTVSDPGGRDTIQEGTVNFSMPVTHSQS